MRLRLLSIFIFCTLIILPGSAQIPAAKLFAYSDGDIWTWFEGGTPQQITDWGYNGGPILSPDERFIAYLSLSTEGLEEINAGVYPFMGTPPSNIWIMDTATQLAERIAIQDSYPVLRGLPAWSPTGRELAWIEFNQNSQAGLARLLIYDMDTRQTTILNDSLALGFQDAGYFIHPVQWGVHGISRLFFTFAETGQLQFILELYNPETGELSQFLLSVQENMGDTSNEAMIPIDYVWVLHQGQNMIAVLNRTGTWYLLDPLTGNRYELRRGPSLVNSSSASITPTWTAANSWEIHWTVNDGTIRHDLPLVSYSISQGAPSLSFDGSAVAWNDNGDVSYMPMIGTGASTLLIDSSETSSFVQPPSVAWSAMTWATKAETGAPIATPVLGTGDACGLASRLSIGDTVTVSQGEPNNVRRDARLSSPVTAQFAPGVLAEVVDGPVCIDGFRWWYVSNADFAGWTAEGNATEYWLEPVRG